MLGSLSILDYGNFIDLRLFYYFTIGKNIKD